MLKYLLFDWGDTLMRESGPPDIPMADWPEVSCIDGAADILARLAKSYRISVATNANISTRADVLRALDRVNLRQHIDEVFCFAELGCKKADPGFWAAVQRRLGAQSDELIVIGDSLEQDVLGPMRAGIRAIWFNWKGEGYSGTASFPCIQSLRELPAAIACNFGEIRGEIR